MKLADGSVYSESGKPNFTDVRVSGSTSTSEARAELPNPAGFLHPGQFVRVTLTGLASIPRRDLDFRGTASLMRPAASGDADAASFDLPFLLHGSWDNPSLAPDPSVLIRRSQASPH